jgi:DNA ligase (NAD+)
MNDNITYKIKELVNKLNEAAKSYYQYDKEIISNLEYDRLYDELVILEEKTGIILSGSPTQKVGCELLSQLPKEKHKLSMLSLDKTKDITQLISWLKNEKGLLSWKLDGLTIVLTYVGGKLNKAVTRGNGEVGEVVTNNAKVFKNVPVNIPFKNELVIRGEAVIKYSDFNKINEQLSQEEKYKNPRNLCSGSVRQLNNEITAKRNVNFFAFQVVEASGQAFNDSKYDQLKWLEELGFDVVYTEVVTKDTIEDKVKDFGEKISQNDFGSDGLVLTYDSINYSNSLGSTSKFPRHSIAYKWQDEIKNTKLLSILWSASRTGLINPIAIFEPVELEGTTVSRASVHNISILEDLELGIGDTISVYKANMIIPQIAENITKSNNIEIPKKCPVCEGETKLEQVNNVKVLYCTNKECQAKKIKSFAHFVSRDAMNIEGLSEATLNKFINAGFIKELSDIFKLETYKEEITNMEGFGEKSYANLIKSIDKSKNVNLPNFIYSLGILNIGLSNAKLLCKYFKYDLDKIIKASFEELVLVEGFGDITAKIIVEYFNDENNINTINNLLEYITFNKESEVTSSKLENKTFVITGSLNEYENRKELKSYIESIGGKVTGSVTSKTDYLINNDTTSTSSKNKKAKELGIPIINEQDFKELIK